MKRKWISAILPFVSMCVGVSGVFWCIILMNDPVGPPPPRTAKEVIRFAVEQNKPPKKNKPKKVKRRRAQNRKAPPAPVMQSGLAGPSFDLPQLGEADLTEGLRDALAQSSKSQVFTADTVDTLPKVSNQVPPKVPMSARRKAITGFVKVRYLITENGRVERVKVVESSPQGIFDEGVLAALHQWTYQPAGYQGESVRISVTKTFRFN
jgi:protein TonB